MTVITYSKIESLKLTDRMNNRNFAKWQHAASAAKQYLSFDKLSEN